MRLDSSMLGGWMRVVGCWRNAAPLVAVPDKKSAGGDPALQSP